MTDVNEAIVDQAQIQKDTDKVVKALWPRWEKLANTIKQEDPEGLTPEVATDFFLKMADTPALNSPAKADDDAIMKTWLSQEVKNYLHQKEKATSHVGTQWKGFRLEKDEPLAISFNKAVYTLGQQGEWVRAGYNKPLEPRLQRMLDQAATKLGHDLSDEPAMAAESRMPFLNEITEARMYRGTSTLEGKSIDELAQITYMMILLIELLRKEDPSQARRYIYKTPHSTNFEKIRHGASDLHNLLAIIKNQEEHVDRITPNPYITVPMLTMKKYLRDIENDAYRRGEVRPFITKLESFFGIRDSNLKKIRRVILYWDRASMTEKADIKKKMKHFFQRYSFNNDLYVAYRDEL